MRLILALALDFGGQYIVSSRSYITIFSQGGDKTMLATLTVPGSCAQKTLVSAMVLWEIAENESDALRQIESHPGVDFAKISNSVIAGLKSCAKQLGCSYKKLISEEDLSPLANLSADQIIVALDVIHKRWVDDNLTASKWTAKFFNGKLSQYRNISHLEFDEVMTNYLFIKEYLIAANCQVSFDKLQKAFDKFRFVNYSDPENSDVTAITEIAYGFRFTIVYEINDFRLKSILADQPEMTRKVDSFLESHEDSYSIMGAMFSAL